MTDLTELGPRIGVSPWRLYQAGNLEALRPRRDLDGFYGRMLREDLQRRRYAYEIEFEPIGASVEDAVDVIVALLGDFDSTGYGADAAALICAVADCLLRESVGSDGLFLELHLRPVDDLGGRPSRSRRRAPVECGEGVAVPSLGYIPGWSARAARSGLRQASPETGRQTIVIPTSRVRQVRLSRPVRAAWRRAVGRLRKIDEIETFGTTMSRVAWPGYDFSADTEAREIALASATMAIGWDGRGAFSKWMTSSYVTYRELRFAHFWIEVIGDVVRFLNEITGSHAVYGDAGFRFALRGLPSPVELERAMAEVRSGELTVREANRNFLSPRYWRRDSV